MCVINFCKQDISKTYLWSFRKFIADTAYTLPWRWSTFGADHIQNG